MMSCPTSLPLTLFIMKCLTNKIAPQTEPERTTASDTKFVDTAILVGKSPCEIKGPRATAQRNLKHKAPSVRALVHLTNL